MKTRMMRVRRCPWRTSNPRPLGGAPKTGLARQTILNQIRRGDRDAIHVTQGQRRGLRVQLHPQEQGLLPAATGDAR
jgi:hypothetical protein